jgi:hypothetical protein
MNVFSLKTTMVVFTMLMSSWLNAQAPYVVINELNADNPGAGGGPGGGTDAAEFIELYGDANVALDSLVLVFFNGGQGGVSYAAYDLDGYFLDSYGFFTIGAATVPGVDFVFPNATNNIQNGADAIGLYYADAVDFPTGTLPNTANLIDAIVYGTNDPQDNALIALLGLDVATPGYVQLDETAQTTGTDLTLSRIPDGGLAFSMTYTLQALTPDTYNQPPCVASVVVFSDNSNAVAFCDNADGIVTWMSPEGEGNHVSVITDADGIIVYSTMDSTYDFTAMVGSYLIFDLAFTQNILDNGLEVGNSIFNVVADECLALGSPATVEVQMCSGCTGGEVFADGASTATVIVDASIDNLVWSNSSTSLTALYAYVLTDTMDQFIMVVDDLTDFNNLPIGWYRIHGVSYMTSITWPMPGESITATYASVCLDWSINVVEMHVLTIPYVVINELNADNPGGGGGGGNQDQTEFIELFGEPNASLDGLSLIFYNGTGAVSYAAYDLDGYTLNAFGFFVLGNPAVAEADMFFNNNTNNIQNGADAVALVIGDAADYPMDTPINGLNLVDAIVYGTDDPQDDALIAGLGLDVLVPGYFQQDETAQNGGADLSLSRIPDGGDAFSITYVVQGITTGTWNQPPCSITQTMLADSSLSLVFCDTDDIVWTMAAFSGDGNFIHVVTNANDTIVTTATTESISINAAIGEYRVYTIAYTGALDANSIAAGQPVSAVMTDECVALSANFVTIEIVTCSGCIGGEVLLNGWPNATVLSNGNTTNLTLSSTSTSLDDAYVYALLGTDSLFITWLDNSFDFAALAVGSYYVLGISYQGSLTGATPGALLDGLSASTCFELSDNMAQILVLNVNSVVINELNADNPGGPDTAEFIELIGEPNASLDNLVVVCYDGATLTSYASYDLDGYMLDENGFFVIGNAATTNVDYIIADASIQNGSDAIAIYAANDLDFPTGSALTTIGLIEAMVYATGDAQVDGLISGLGLDILYPGYAQFDETAQQNGLDLTQSRVPDGGIAFDNSSVVLQPLTPGTFNILEPGCMNANACNYNPNALIDDATCIFVNDPCDDNDPETVNDAYDVNCACVGLAPLAGCIDFVACNYNPLATEDDGSCVYAGGSCDDGDPNTINDVYDNNCVCTGVVGVLEWSTATAMTIYPNPAQSTLTLQWVGDVTGAVLVDVCDLTGKVIKSFSRQIYAQQAMQMDIADLAIGMYQMRAKSDQGVAVREFVKQ